VVVAVLGTEPEDDRGKFHVEDYCFQLLPEQPALPPLSDDRLVIHLLLSLHIVCLHHFFKLKSFLGKGMLRLLK